MICVKYTQRFSIECVKWDKVFRNRPSEICGRQPLKNFTWLILEYFEYFVPNIKNPSLVC